MGKASDLITKTRQEFTDETQPQVDIPGEDMTVNADVVWKAVMELKSDKACGPEGMYVELLKNGTDKLFRMLMKIIN